MKLRLPLLLCALLAQSFLMAETIYIQPEVGVDTTTIRFNEYAAGDDLNVLGGDNGKFNLYGTPPSGIGSLSLWGGISRAGGNVTAENMEGNLDSFTAINVYGNSGYRIPFGIYQMNSLRQGSLVLSGYGSATEYTVNAPITLYSGALVVWTHGSVDKINVASLHLESGSNLLDMFPVAADTYTITNVTRSKGATLSAISNYGNMSGADISLYFTNIDDMNGADGIIGGWATGGVSWDGNNDIYFLEKQVGDKIDTLFKGNYGDARKTSAQANGPNAGNAALDWYNDEDNTGDKAIVGDLSLNSLLSERNIRLGNDARLVLTSGGLILNGEFWICSPDGGGGLTNGQITSGMTSGELFVYVKEGDGIQPVMKAVFADNGSTAVTLIKDGPGRLGLQNINIHTGGTIVNRGILDLQSSGTIRNLLTIESGAIVWTSAKDTMGYQAGACVTGITINEGTLIAKANQRENLAGKDIILKGGTMTTEGTSNYEFWNGGGYGAILKATTVTTLPWHTVSVISGNTLSLDQPDTVFTVGANTLPQGVLAVDLIVDVGFSTAFTSNNTNITKTGAGVMLINGASTFTGKTLIQGGTLQAGSASAFSTGAIEVSDATLDGGGFALTNTSLKITGTGTIKNVLGGAGTALSGNFQVQTTAQTNLNVFSWENSQLTSTAAQSVVLLANNQVRLSNQSRWTVGAAGQSNVAQIVLTENNVVGGSSLGQSIWVSDSSSTLTLAGNIELDLSSVVATNLSDSYVSFQLVSLSDASNFSTWSASHLVLTSLGDFTLIPGLNGGDNTVTRWKAKDLTSVVAELKQSGTITLQALPAVYQYLSDDTRAYTYTFDGEFFGAKVAGLNFTQPFTFAPDVDQVYGFVVSNSPTDTGHSFTVSSLLNDAGGIKSSVDIVGNLSEGRKEVTLANRNNSFTGDVFVTQATLVAKAASTTSGNVSLLGVGNTVQLMEGAWLNLATGPGTYTYGNNIYFRGNSSQLINSVGTNELTGTVKISNAPTALISNTSSGDLTLSGNVTDVTGFSTLQLKTGTGSGRIILGAAANQLYLLEVNGQVALMGNTAPKAGLITNGLIMVSGGLNIGNANLTIGAAGISSTGTNQGLTFNESVTVNATASWLAPTNVSWNLLSGSIVNINTNANDVTINGSLTGMGTLEKSGTGKLTLAGTSSYSGEVTVRQGALAIGSSASFAPASVTMKSGTTLSVTGQLTSNQVMMESGSTLTGKSVGNDFTANLASGSQFTGSLLEHTGNVTFASGSMLVTVVQSPNAVNSGTVMTKRGSGSRINLQGLTIQGSAVNELDWAVHQTRSFTLMYADGGFGGTDVSLADTRWNNFLIADLVFDGKYLNVELTRTIASITDYAHTNNQFNTAQAMDSIVNNIGSLNLSGTPLGAIADYFASTDLETMAGPTLDKIAGLSNYQLMAGQRLDLLRHVESVRQRSLQNLNIQAQRGEAMNNFWVEGTQSYYRYSDTLESPGFDHSTWGGALGCDVYANNTLTIGVAFAYSNVETKSNAYNGKSTTDLYYVDLYGFWQKGAWVSTMVLSAGFSDSDIHRDLYGLGSPDGRAKGSSSGNSFIGQWELGYAFKINEEKPGQMIMPVLSMTLGTTQTDAYSETGLGNAGLQVNPESMTIAQLAGGVRCLNQNIDIYMEKVYSSVEFRALVVHEFGDGNYSTVNNFIGAPQYSFRTQGVEVQRTSLVVGLGVSHLMSDDWTWFMDVNGEIREHAKGMNATLGIRTEF